MAIGVWRNRQRQSQVLYKQVDERLFAKTPIPLQRGYNCNLESGGEEYSKTRNKEILTTFLLIL
jgi:hypothetical protein